MPTTVVKPKIKDRLVFDGHFKYCSICNSRMRSIMNQNWLMTVRPELGTNLNELRVNLLKGEFVKSSFELEEGKCDKCSVK